MHMALGTFFSATEVIPLTILNSNTRFLRFIAIKFTIRLRALRVIAFRFATNVLSPKSVELQLFNFVSPIGVGLVEPIHLGQIGGWQ